MPVDGALSARLAYLSFVKICIGCLYVFQRYRTTSPHRHFGAPPRARTATSIQRVKREAKLPLLDPQSFGPGTMPRDSELGEQRVVAFSGSSDREHDPMGVMTYSPDGY